jgi:hypothetical protein
MSTAFAVVVAGGDTAPAYLEPEGQVIVLPPVASCVAMIVNAKARPDGALENVNVVLPVIVKLNMLLVDKSSVTAPVELELAQNSDVALKTGAIK